jgi:hypothetical protein
MPTNDLSSQAFSFDEIVEAIRLALANIGQSHNGNAALMSTPPKSIDEGLPLESRRALSEAQAASYLNISVSNLRKLRMNKGREGHMPQVPYVQLGRRISYLRDDLDKILVANRVEVSK